MRRVEKFKKRLIAIKQELMREIASLLVNGCFNMAKETPIYYYDGDSIGGPILLSFDHVEGDENKIKLIKSDTPFACQISFDKDENFTVGMVEGEIMFLSKLLDYVELDKKDYFK